MARHGLVLLKTDVECGETQSPVFTYMCVEKHGFGLLKNIKYGETWSPLFMYAHVARHDLAVRNVSLECGETRSPSLRIICVSIGIARLALNAPRLQTLNIKILLSGSLYDKAKLKAQLSRAKIS